MANAPRRRWQIIHADCLTTLPKLDPTSIDAVITDPPYGISIFGMKWDKLDPHRAAGRKHSPTSPSAAFRTFVARWAAECMRVMKPGAHLAAFAAPRTAHLMTSGIEDAGFEIRDTLMWLQGQGYPASRQLPGGRGTELKPAYEPIILARKPLDGTLHQTLATYGTGALNIDACRIQDPTIPRPTQGHARKRYSATQKDAGLPTCSSPTTHNAVQRDAGAAAQQAHSAQTTVSSTAPEPTNASVTPAATSYPATSPKPTESAPATSNAAMPAQSLTTIRPSSQST